MRTPVSSYFVFSCFLSFFFFPRHFLRLYCCQWNSNSRRKSVSFVKRETRKTEEPAVFRDFLISQIAFSYLRRGGNHSSRRELLNCNFSRRVLSRITPDFITQRLAGRIYNVIDYVRWNFALWETIIHSRYSFATFRSKLL